MRMGSNHAHVTMATDTRVSGTHTEGNIWPHNLVLHINPITFMHIIHKAPCFHHSHIRNCKSVQHCKNCSYTSNTHSFHEPPTSMDSPMHEECKYVIACWNLHGGHWHACQWHHWHACQWHHWPFCKMTCPFHFSSLLEHSDAKTENSTIVVAKEIITSQFLESETLKFPSHAWLWFHIGSYCTRVLGKHVTMIIQAQNSQKVQLSLTRVLVAPTT